VVLGSSYECDVPLFRSILTELGCTPALAHDCPWYGIIMTSTANPAGERILHLLNLDGFDKEIGLTENGMPLFGGRRITLRSREGLMLPLGLRYGETTIVWATAELQEAGPARLAFRQAQAEDAVALRTPLRVSASPTHTVQTLDGTTIIRAPGQTLTVRLS
jgi:beta-galactosidase